MSTSLTNICRSTVMRPCQWTMGRTPQWGLTDPPTPIRQTAAVLELAKHGLTKVSRPHLLPPVKLGSRGLISRLNNSARATTVISLAAHPLALTTHPTAARHVLLLCPLPQPPLRSPAPSAITLTSRVQTTTTLTLAMLPASTSTPTSIPRADPTQPPS